MTEAAAETAGARREAERTAEAAPTAAERVAPPARRFAARKGPLRGSASRKTPVRP
jgi:hypothetical protein